VLRGWRKNHNGQNLGRGIALNGVAGVTVASNTISRPNGTGILLTGCNPHICHGSSTQWRSTKARLLGNTIVRATGGSRPGAIAVIRTRRSVVQDNRASRSSPYDFSGCGRCKIRGNRQ
jgi:parallel beta-helix repeat protein